ncbi:MAG: ATP-binding protein [Candidatus Bathyarchaeia archaeon]
MLSLFAWFALAGGVICLLLAVFVYFFNRKDPLNRIFIYAILFGAYSAFTTFMVLTAENAEAAYLWNKIGFLWSFFPALLLQFTLVFTENSLATDERSYIILYLPALLFSLFDLTTDQLSGFPVLGEWGYTLPGAGNWINIASNIWSAIVSSASIFLCGRYYFKAGEESKKQQAKVITIALTYPIVLTVLSKAASLLFGWSIPHTGGGSNAILCVFVVYAIWKYGLFNISPAMAAENIIATMPDSFILTNPEGRILRANPSVANLLGYAENELTGKTVYQLLTEEQTVNMLKSAAGKLEIRNHETYMKTKLATQKPVAISISTIENKKGKTLGLILIIHDLTRRRQYEEKIVKAERLATIGELAGMIGHDLRNPLTSIQGAAYYLKLKRAKDPNGSEKEMLETIERSVEYSNKIIGDLLDYSREIRLETEETTPKTLVAKALADLPKPENINLIDHTREVPVLWVDTAKMMRVFINLLKNAFEAMPDGGTLTITSTETQGNAEIRLEDTGTGMTQETMSKVWTPLFTTKAKGMGFGLPICKRIVEAHGGRIHVQSTLGEGTAFTVVLPLNIQPKAQTAENADVAIAGLTADSQILQTN